MIGMAKKNKAEKKIFRKMAKAHFVFSLSLFFLYFVLSLIYSPEFLIFDARTKFRALADEILVVTASVLGPPVKPAVFGEAVCKNGNLSIKIDWDDDKNSKTFDIDRDDMSLVTGLVDSRYDDANVVTSASYVYTVTARGPMGPGIAVSDPIAVTTPDECEVPLPDPAIEIVSFAGKSVASYKGIPEAFSRRPVFSGTTNIARAEISLFIDGSAVIFARVLANANGYWSWEPPAELNYGRSVLLAKAADPNNPFRESSDSLTFRIVRKEKEREGEEKKDEEKIPAPPFVPESKPPETAPPKEDLPANPPLDFSLLLKSETVFQGRELGTVINVTGLMSGFEGSQAIVRYTLFDEAEEKRKTFFEEILLENNLVFQKNIAIPAFWKGGQHRVQAEIIFDRYNISREGFFEILELPLLNFGGGVLVTYPELLSNLGAVASIFLLLLLVWLFLFFREYQLQLRAFRHITERHLEKMGFLGTKKGKGVSR